MSKNWLYIFAPSKCWKGCGGMVVVSGSTFEEATTRANNLLREDHKPLLHFITEDFTVDGASNVTNTFVLQATIAIAEDVRVLALGYNATTFIPYNL